jgi:predicted NBD/HSP70 family sugar kinase
MSRGAPQITELYYSAGMKAWSAAQGGAHISDVRERNLALVLSAVQERGTASLAELAEGTALAPGSINKLVSQLLDLGLLVDHSTRSSGRRGRPERVLAVGNGRALAVGIDVNSERIDIRVEQLAGEVVDSVSVLAPGHISLKRIGQKTATRLYGLLQDEGLEETPVAMTVALPSLVADGIVNSPARGWHHVRTTAFSDTFKLDMRSFEAVNDGVAAVTAEYWAAGRSHYSSLALLHGTDAIAGGLIDHGSHLRGWKGAAGTFGHLVVEPGGRLCPCGQQGCLSLYASIPAIWNDAKQPESHPGEASLLELARELARLAAQGDAQVLQALEVAQKYLKRAISVLGPTVSPERVVVSGNLVPLFDWIVPRIPERDITDGFDVIHWERPAERSDLAQNAVVIGATWLSRKAILTTPLKWKSRVG